MKVLGVGGGISGTNTSDAKRKGRNAQQQPGYVIWNHGFMSRPLPHPLRMLFLGLIKNQLEDQCQPMLISKPKHEPHSSWSFQTGRQEWGQKSQGYAESLTFTTSQSTGRHPLPNLLKILWIAGSVPFRHLLETSLRWHGWASEILPSNKQADIQWSNLHKTKNNSLAFEA